jgi:putative flavoprotein involved in K+ transport
VARSQIDAPAAEDDPVEAPEPGLGVDPPRELDLRAAGIRTVVWATGFGGDFDWLPRELLERSGAPAHTDGVGHIPGLYVLGFPWTSKRKSGIIYGVEEDARRIAAHVAAAASRSASRGR